MYIATAHLPIIEPGKPARTQEISQLFMTKTEARRWGRAICAQHTVGNPFYRAMMVRDTEPES